jgi:hypothetical protein
VLRRKVASDPPPDWKQVWKIFVWNNLIKTVNTARTFALETFVSKSNNFPHQGDQPTRIKRFSKSILLLMQKLTGLQINLYLQQLMEIQLFATFFQRIKWHKKRLTF